MKALGIVLTVLGAIATCSWTYREGGIVCVVLGVSIIAGYTKEA